MCEWPNIKCLIHKNKNTMTNKTPSTSTNVQCKETKYKKKNEKKKESVPCGLYGWWFFSYLYTQKPRIVLASHIFLAAFYDSYGNETYICCAYLCLFNEFCFVLYAAHICLSFIFSLFSAKQEYKTQNDHKFP